MPLQRVHLLLVLINWTWFITVDASNLGLWSSSFLHLESCERTKQQGEWCEWLEWGACEITTCTRIRRRICACPQPDDWNSTACSTILPQDDMRIGNV